MVIDVHFHPFREVVSTKSASEMFRKFGFPEETVFSSVFQNAQVFERVDLQDPLQATLYYMRIADVQYAVLSGENDLVLEWAKKQPDKFVPFYCPSIPPKDSESMFEWHGQAVDDCFEGIGELVLALHGMSLDDKRMFPLYAWAEQLGMLVEFHAGGNLPCPKELGYPAFKIMGANPLLLENVVTRFPKLKVVLCHMGYPFADEANHMAFTYPHVYIEISCVDFSRQLYNLLRNAVDAVGAGKLLFGSDAVPWPYVIPLAVSNVKNVDFLSKKEKNLILEENARNLIARTRQRT